jgi:FPC/CPF motif-containing protein YcgG
MYVSRNCNSIRVHVVNKAPWAEDMTTINAGFNEFSFAATGRTFYFIFTRHEILSTLRTSLARPVMAAGFE